MWLPFPERLFHAGDLVGQRQNPSFPAMGQVAERERPHVAFDHGLLFRGDMEVAFGVAGGDEGVVAAVQVVMVVMPVVEVVVVEDGGADQGPLVRMDAEFFRQKERKAGDME